MVEPGCSPMGMTDKSIGIHISKSQGVTKYKVVTVLDLGFDQGGGIPHQAEKGGGIWQLGGGVF